MPAIVNIQSSDKDNLYWISAQMLGPRAASISERKQNKSTGAVTNTTIPITDIAVVNGVLKGKGHFVGGLTQDISLEPSDPGDQPTETIETGGFLFGVGAQKLGPFPVSAASYADINTWFENFPRS